MVQLCGGSCKVDIVQPRPIGGLLWGSHRLREAVMVQRE